MWYLNGAFKKNYLSWQCGECYLYEFFKNTVIENVREWGGTLKTLLSKTPTLLVNWWNLANQVSKMKYLANSPAAQKKDYYNLHQSPFQWVLQKMMKRSKKQLQKIYRDMKKVLEIIVLLTTIHTKFYKRI